MFVVKFQYQTEIRRAALNEVISFVQLTQLAKELYGESLAQSSTLVFKYKDDEDDSITVSTDRELEEAFRLMRETRPAILKVEIQAEEVCSKGSCHARGSWVPRSGCGRTRDTANQHFLQVGHSAICDSCESKIFDTRYKCLVCPDYDLCENCTKKEGVHDDHPFLRITDPTFPLGCAVRRGFWGRDPCKRNWGCVAETKPKEEQKVEEKEQALNSPVAKPSAPKQDEPTGKQEEDRLYPELNNVTISVSPIVEQNTSHSVPTVDNKKEEIVPEETKKELTAFESKLKQLGEMGFLDKNKNIELLIKNGGDILVTVKNLLDL